MSDWVNCLHDNSWFTLAPFLYHPNLFETFALPYCIKFFSFFKCVCGCQMEQQHAFVKMFFLWFAIFYWLQAFRTEMFFYCCVNLSVLNQITIIIVCRRADRIPQYLLININSKQIQYHCILLKMHLFLLFQTLWLQNFYIV